MSGFAILLVALASGAAMIARGVVLARTGHQEAAYHSTAPLKPLHGVSLHAVLVLPALAWLLSRTSWSEAVRRRTVTVAVGCYVVAVAARRGVGGAHVLTATPRCSAGSSLRRSRRSPLRSPSVRSRSVPDRWAVSRLFRSRS